eukprot:Skav224536  [mRNA]  locus=scaffold388:754282:779504:+ [translate_table: standard]
MAAREQLTALLPPVARGPRLIEHMRSQDIQTDNRLQILRNQMQAWAGDELSWQFRKLAQSVGDTGIGLLDPLMVTGWSMVGTETMVQAALSRYTTLTHIGSAVLYKGHWMPFDEAIVKQTSSTACLEQSIVRSNSGCAVADMLEDIRREVQAQDFSAARDISKPTAKVLFLHKANPARNSSHGANAWRSRRSQQDQVATIPLLEVKEDRIVCGTIPTIWAMPHWPLWFPFCDSCRLLRRFSPSCFVMNCTLKVLFLHIDFICFVDITDKLHTSEECLEILMRSPPPGSEGQEWMRTTIPPKCGSLPRICVRNAALRLRPTAHDQFQCDLQMELDDPAGAPQWVKVFVFQQLAIRIIPELCKFQSKIPGPSRGGRSRAQVNAAATATESLWPLHWR